MKVTYFALKSIMVGATLREPGDLVPEAAAWPYLSGYIADGRISPVLVVTLPEEVRTQLEKWEKSVNGDTQVAGVPTTEDFHSAEDVLIDVKSVIESAEARNALDEDPADQVSSEQVDDSTTESPAKDSPSKGNSPRKNK